MVLWMSHRFFICFIWFVTVLVRFDALGLHSQSLVKVDLEMQATLTY